MKTKKALAVILAVVMLVMPLAVSSFAASGEIVATPLKTAYNDSEYFNPIGLVINYEGDTVTYAPGDSDFRFDPALNELLTVETKEVAVYYDNKLVATVPVTVEHILGELTAIDNGHGKYCLGCGTLHEFELHTITEWIPNDDGGIFTMQTQTGKCDICAKEITEGIPGTAKFDSLFDTEMLAPLEGTILEYISKILVSLIQMLVSIK